MNISPINFLNQSKNPIRAKQGQLINFQAKKDEFEKSRPSETTSNPFEKMERSDAELLIEKLNSFFGVDLKSFITGNLGQIYEKLNPTINKYTNLYYGTPLLTSDNLANKNQEKYKKAIEYIKTIGHEKLTGKAKTKTIKAENPVLWSLSSEFAPMKEGGLGVVPPAIQDNANSIGVDVPTFIPMYLQNGISNLTKTNNNYTYKYTDKEFALEKAVTFKMDVFQNGEVKTVPIEVFVNEKDGKELVFIKCDDYFDGSIYESNTKVQEPEKFAIFSKAVYELAKLKVEGPTALKDVEINSTLALDFIKAPDGMILNDWQASPYAALARYKAPLENACGQLSDEACEKLKNMNIITIGHNPQYQGIANTWNDAQRRNNNANILNTLFDKFTYDIVSNAKTDPESQNPDSILLMPLENEGYNHVNLLNMGIILSDYFCPVSKNYAKELIAENREDLSYELHQTIIEKAKAKKLVGIINGNDFNKLSIEAKKDDFKKQIGFNYTTYNRNNTIEEITRARLENKKALYRNFILPFVQSASSNVEQIEKVKKLTEKLEYVKVENQKNIVELSDEELAKTPILTAGGRLVSQKGVDILCDSIKTLFDNWEKDFPNCNKPIIYIAGTDGEDGRHKQYIENFISSLGEDSSRVVFAHGFAPVPALMAGSDFFLMTSNFEPCGLTQSESLALATPVIATGVGGLVDTINRDGKTNGILTKSRNEKPNANEYHKALKEGLEIYYHNKEKYAQMVQDSINEDFSWILPNQKGPVYDYLKLIGIKTK